MDNLKGQYLENTYKVLTPLQDKDSCSTFLVKNTSSGSLAVKKQISSLQYPIYQKLKETSHPNLARIFETYSIDGQYFVIEDYISGSTIGRSLEQGYHFSLSEIRSILTQLCNVLAFLHARNIIHRDITPDNVLISTDHVLKLIDFGISRTKKCDQSNDTVILGTAGYAAPEQFGFAQTDERSDIYSVGVLLNVMLTGSLPGQVLTDNPYYRQIVLRCTCIDPNSRYHSIQELKNVLSPKEKTTVPKIKSTGLLAHLPGFRTGNPFHMTAGIITYIILAILGYGACFSELKPDLTRLEIVSAVILWFYVPWAVWTDFGYYTRRFKVFQNASTVKKIILKSGLCAVSFLIFILILLVKMLFAK